MLNKKIIILKMEDIMKNPISILLLIFSLSFAQIPSRGLVAFFPFKDTIKDECNNITKVVPMELKYILKPEKDRFNQENSAALCYNNSYLGLTFEDTNNKLPFKSNNFTVCLWYYRRSDVSSYQPLDHLLVYGDSLIHENGKIQPKKMDGFRIFEDSTVYIKVSYNNKIIKTYNPYNSETWIFFGVSVSGNTIKTYLGKYNSTIVESETANDFSISQNIPNIFSIGTLPLVSEDTIGSFYSYRGKIDDISIYNRALSEEEITQIYNDTKSTINKAPIFLPSILDTTIKPLDFLTYTINIQNDDSFDNKYNINNGIATIVSYTNTTITLRIAPSLKDTGKHTIKLIAVDYLKDSSFMDIIITVKKPDNKLIITSTADSIAYVNKLYEYEVKFSNPELFSSLSVTKGTPSKPSNLKIKNTTIEFTPLPFYQDKTIALTIAAINIYKDTTFQTINIKIKGDETSTIQQPLTIIEKNNLNKNSPIYLINGKKINNNNTIHTIFIINNNKILNLRNKHDFN